jgi:hypothetical protein
MDRRRKGYVTSEGLDYEFRQRIRSTGGQNHNIGGQRIGAYQSFEQDRSADVSCACHWTINVAATAGSMPISIRWRQRGSSSPRTHRSGTRPNSPMCRSLPADMIKMSFEAGLLFRRRSC